MVKITEQTPPYCQFIRGSANRFGLGIDLLNAQKAEFGDNPLWQKVTHEFGSSSEEEIYLSRSPRMLVINRSQAMMSDNGRNIYAYDREHCRGYRAFSYWVVWFVDAQNKPLSRLPFRLKCTGYQGTTLMKLYDYPNETDTFSQRIVEVYQRLAKNPQIENPQRFLAHAVYQPNLIREMKASRQDPQRKSMTVMAKDYLMPTVDNFADFIVRNGSLESQFIDKFITETKPWLRESAIKPLEIAK